MNPILVGLVWAAAALFTIVAALVTAACVQTTREHRARLALRRPLVVTGRFHTLSPTLGVVVAWRTKPARWTDEEHREALELVRRHLPTLAEQLDRLAAAQDLPKPGPVAPGLTLGEAVAAVGERFSAPAGSVRSRTAQALAVQRRRCETQGHEWREDGMPQGMRECTRCGAWEGAA